VQLEGARRALARRRPGARAPKLYGGEVSILRTGLGMLLAILQLV
jgi:hypothetical protein